MWKLKRSEVEIVTEPSKIRERHIYTEEEYDLKCGVQPPKVAKVILDKSALLDDIETQRTLLLSPDLTEETKGMYSFEHDCISQKEMQRGYFIVYL